MHMHLTGLAPGHVSHDCVSSVDLNNSPSATSQKAETWNIAAPHYTELSRSQDALIECLFRSFDQKWNMRDNHLKA